MQHNPTPDISSRLGAPMGRHTGPDYLELEAGPWSLRRIRLDQGGYDAGGAYWGLGQPLFYVCDQDGNEAFFRAADREAAKAALTEKWSWEGKAPRFYR